MIEIASSPRSSQWRRAVDRKLNEIGEAIAICTAHGSGDRQPP
ncbi:MAG: hypothetical protein ACREFB_05975 [Stellaceae bacterium]